MAMVSTLRMTLRTLLARKARTLLTMLGIIIGVAGVITIISLGAGAQSLILGQVTKLGSNLLSIQPGKSTENGPPVQAFGVVITTLTNQDVDALRDPTRLPRVTAVNPGVQGSVTVTWGSKSIDSSFIGTDASYPQVVNFSMQSGQFFDQQQEQGGGNVVVLGASISDELFSGTGVDPVGQIIKVKNSNQTEAGGIPLRVIGVISPRGSSFFQNQDTLLFLPLHIGQERILGIRHLQMINVKVEDAPFVDQTIEDVTRVLRQMHRIQPGEEDDFTVRNQADAIKILSTITNAMSLFLTAMAAISLIVGGIGILNIMLVTVAERTREIGLRKAVGATNGAVMRQFLIEAGTLTTIGGAIGIVLGILVSFGIASLMKRFGYDWAFIVSVSSIALAIGVSILTGVIFGLYPAQKAARLNPIEALRYE